VWAKQQAWPAMVSLAWPAVWPEQVQPQARGPTLAPKPAEQRLGNPREHSGPRSAPGPQVVSAA